MSTARRVRFGLLAVSSGCLAAVTAVLHFGCGLVPAWAALLLWYPTIPIAVAASVEAFSDKGTNPSNSDGGSSGLGL